MKRTISLIIILSLCFAFASCVNDPEDTLMSTDSNDSSVISSQPSQSQVSEVSETVSQESAVESEISDTDSDISEENSETSEVSDATSDTTLARKSTVYVSLGDSIPRGYGLTDPQNQSFPSILAESFKGFSETVKFENAAVDGNTSSDLLQLLKSENSPSLLKDADIITVTIGANNLLKPFSAAMQKVFENSLSDIDFSNMDSSKFFAVFPQIADDVNSALNSDDFNSEMKKGLDTLKSELPLIFSRLKTISPNAKIYITTVYNPYKGLNIRIPNTTSAVMLENIANVYILQLNDIIKESASKAEIEVVDIYTAFEESTEQLVNAIVSIIPPVFSFDPHPNQAGHLKIAETYLKALSEFK